MKIKKLLSALIIPLLLISAKVFATEDKILFEENKNQWVQQVKYRVGVGNGTTLFMENNKFTFVKYDPAQLEEIHEESHKKQNSIKSGIVNFHAFQMNFVGASTDVEISSAKKTDFYHNYFIGNDPAKWASNVGLFEEVTYKNIYSNIDLHAYQEKQSFKYDFIVGAGGNPSLIQMKFDGADNIKIKNNRLIIKTSVGDIIENSPFTYQIIDDIKKEVKCQYILSADGKTVSFNFPNGFDDSYELIIDPVLVGATYSGASGASVYGHCATYDLSGNIYTGGESFGSGYPTTLGAFQSAFAGSQDISISKLNPTGTALIWASYIGGSSQEIPNSLFVGATGEIYVLGATSSSDFPTSAGCYDNSHNGGEDITVTHFNTTGTALVGSTYVGGNNDDGGGSAPFNLNGHDDMRGEIIVDATGNAWIASWTDSPNFPATAGAYKTTLGGTYDACLFRLSSNLSALQWSTFFGGTGDECAYGLRLNTTGQLYFTGATSGGNFPTTAGVYDASFNGGGSDGYIAKFNATGSALLAASYIGSAQGDISYFLDLDNVGDPYIYGSSAGTMPVTAGVYSNAGGGNFVSKFNTSLTVLSFSTIFGGAGGWNNHLEPEAFMVDVCGNIYMSGFMSASSYPTTTNALFTTPPSGGDNCYFIVLSKNATSLLYGSFYYGSHVDGGTSRFDPSGSIYQGICIGGSGATATPGAYASGGGAPSWDMFVVKIAFQYAGVTAVAAPAPNDTVCMGTAINFVNNSTGAVNYVWTFGDGTPSSIASAPVHNYATPGTYNVTLIAYDSTGCVFSDTSKVVIVVLPGPVANIGKDTTMCITPNMVLNAGNPGCTYVWSTGATTQTLNVNSYGTYWVTVDNGVCSHSDTIIISKITLPGMFGKDTTLCAGQNITLTATGGGSSYLWSTGATTQSINVNTTGTYFVTVPLGLCVLKDTINVTIIPYPIVNLGPDKILCPGDQFVLNGGGPATSYLWSTGDVTQSITVTSPNTYSVITSNKQCITKDTVTIDYVEPIGWITPTNFCNEFEHVLDAGPNADSYFWSTGETTQSIAASEQGSYWVTMQIKGCTLKDTMYVDHTLGGATIFFPNTFTPNGNGLNDLFNVKGFNLTSFEMVIFNRWGEQIYKTSDQYAGWDGYYNGILVKQDVYVYKIKYKTSCSGDATQEKMGHVTVLR